VQKTEKVLDRWPSLTGLQGFGKLQNYIFLLQNNILLTAMWPGTLLLPNAVNRFVID